MRPIQLPSKDAASNPRHQGVHRRDVRRRQEGLQRRPEHAEGRAVPPPRLKPSPQAPHRPRQGPGPKPKKQDHPNNRCLNTTHPSMASKDRLKSPKDREIWLAFCPSSSCAPPGCTGLRASPERDPRAGPPSVGWPYYGRGGSSWAATGLLRGLRAAPAVGGDSKNDVAPRFSLFHGLAHMF